MFALFWNLSAALNGYMRFYMPTNRAVDYLRSPRGLKWAIPVALVATLAYLFAMSVCATIIERGGPGYLNVLVMLFAWNAIKFGCLGVLAPFWIVSRSLDGVFTLRNRRSLNAIEGRVAILSRLGRRIQVRLTRRHGVP